MFINRRFSVPISAIEFQAIRASGPGGQHVNKTSSAVHLQLDIMALDIPEAYKERILAHRDKRVSDKGVITIKAQNHRTQIRNRSEAITRLKALLLDAVTIPEPRRATRPSYGAVQRRLKKKTQRSQIKKNRGQVRDFD
ncbi:MAG: alternative ribosome rescue aminoacyl-tRNA hydrolase ArfB [Litorimonas sp.]